MDKLKEKQEVIDLALKQVEDTLKGLKESANMKINAGEASGSSVTQGSFGSGDTGTEDMAKEMAAITLKEVKHLEQVYETFKAYSFTEKHNAIGPLSLVKTDKGAFFITYAVKNVKHNGQTYFMLATDAPIYKCMKDKVEGDQFEFNGNKFQIKEVL